MIDEMGVVGNKPEIGNWNTANAVELEWVDSDTWRGIVAFDASQGQSIQTEFIMKQGGSVTWENGGNRTYTVPSSGIGSTTGNRQFRARLFRAAGVEFRPGRLSPICVGAFSAIKLGAHDPQNARRLE